MTNVLDPLAPPATAHPNPKGLEQSLIGQPAQSATPHEPRPHPCQRAYSDLRSGILGTLTTPRRRRISIGLQHVARAVFLILDIPARWLMDLFDTIRGNRGYLTVGTVLAAYLVLFGLVDTKSTQEETRASIERSIFITLVSTDNAASFVTAMQEFGRTQMMTVTEHPSLLKFWQWGGTHHPNKTPLWYWALGRLGSCGQKEAKDCSLKDDIRLDLKDAELSHAYLLSTDLHNADLDHARLTHADLPWVNLTHADLRHADLDHAFLWGAKLSGADLRHADLDHAKLWGADLSGANLRDVTDWSGADLSGANLSGADLSGAFLHNADLSSTNLSSTNLSGAVLNNADLSGAVLNNADLSGAILRDVTDWSGANLSSTNLSSTNLSSTNLSGAKYSAETIFPANFDPKAAGMVLTDPVSPGP
jgi:uncharacterized protein YjbI with pentapeptide repeats